MQSEAPTIGVIGLGQIGGSISATLEALNYPVIGHDCEPETCRAAARDGIEVVGTIMEVVERSTLVFIAVSIQSNLQVNEEVIAVCRHMTNPPTITDVASYKKGTTIAPGELPYLIPGHPMAGTQLSGYHARNPRLFENSPWVLVIEPGTDPNHLLRLIRVVNLMGAEVQMTTRDWHDTTMSLVSALPHAMSEVLTRTVRTVENPESKLSLAAGSFRSGTRVMLSDPTFVSELLLLNRETLKPLLDRMEAEFRNFSDMLSSGNPKDLLASITDSNRFLNRNLVETKQHGQRRVPEEEVQAFFESLCNAGNSIVGFEEQVGHIDFSIRYCQPSD